MNKEKAASALRMSVGLEARLAGVLTSEMSNRFLASPLFVDLARSGVLRFNGVVVFKDLYWFIFSLEIGSESEVDAVYSAHDVLNLMDGRMLECGLKMLVEGIASPFEPSACGK